MDVKELDRRDWEGCFSSLTSEPVLVAVRLADRAPGSHGEFWRALRSVRYDCDRDVLIVEVGGGTATEVSFFVSAPQRVTLARDRAAKVMIVADAEGAETVVRFAERELNGAPRGGLDSRAGSCPAGVTST